MQYPINVKIIADSISVWGDRITTIEVEYPRYIHAEIMTHRMFSRNAQSSRAVPVEKALEIIESNPVKPIVWGANKAGMSSNSILDTISQKWAESVWNFGVKTSVWVARALAKVGLHKQWANRGTEPYSTIKVIITATEWENFFWLRDDPDAAQPEIVELTRQIKNVMQTSEPNQLGPGEWHVPYVDYSFEWDSTGSDWGRRVQKFFDSDGNPLSLEDALKISASCCAQVSYRKLNDSKEKAIEIFDRLFSGPKPHLSPVEHQAKVVDDYEFENDLPWEKGVTHVDQDDMFWSGNFKGWIQYRQLI